MKLNCVNGVRAIVIAAFVAALTVACQWEDTVYYHYESVDKGWSRGDSLLFPLPVLEDHENYHLFIEVRYTSTYPAMGLNLAVSHNLADSMQWKSDTLEVALRNAEGLFVGKGIAGLYLTPIPLGVFSSDGSRCAMLGITHAMKDSLVLGLHDIGVRIERCK